MTRAALLPLSLALLACGCAKQHSSAHSDHSDHHGHGGLNLPPATEACPGPTKPITVQVLDSPELGPSDPIAFMREPGIAWVVALQVVAAEGEFEAERLGVLVHSPSMFASEVWGFGASPQETPAGLELRWTEEYCLFEVVGIDSPEPVFEEGEEFEFEAPMVHSMILG